MAPTRTHFIASASRSAAHSLAQAMYLFNDKAVRHEDRRQIGELVKHLNAASILLAKACSRAIDNAENKR